ncbi:MAG: ClpX C4-type zinc finger protein, partial [Rhodospirillales bacterium]
QSAVRKLISNPSDEPRAYICDECVSVCAVIIEDERREQEYEELAQEAFRTGGGGLDEAPHPLVGHRLASSFLASVERWIRAESVDQGAAEAFAEMRSIAIQMLSDEGKSGS